MTLRSESRAKIEADIEDVYAYVSDVSRWPEWARAIRECRVAGGASLQAGSRLEQRVQGMFGSTRSRTLDVTATDAPRRLAFAGTMGGSPLRWGFDLGSSGPRQAEMVLWVEIDRRGMARGMPAGILRSMVRKANDGELVAIRSAVESTPRRPDAKASS